MRLQLLALAFFLSACPGYTGPQPDAIYFWKIKTSTLEFGACSDAPDFRSQLMPVEITENTFVIYKVSTDGKTATTQKCTALDSKACTTADSPTVFDITGRELVSTQSSKSPIGTTGCSLQQTETSTITDGTRTMTLDLTNVLTLVDSRPACDTVEADLKARSPNMLGVEGCVITRKLTGELK